MWPGSFDYSVLYNSIIRLCSRSVKCLLRWISRMALGNRYWFPLAIHGNAVDRYIAYEQTNCRDNLSPSCLLELYDRGGNFETRFISLHPQHQRTVDFTKDRTKLRYFWTVDARIWQHLSTLRPSRYVAPTKPITFLSIIELRLIDDHVYYWWRHNYTVTWLS